MAPLDQDIPASKATQEEKAGTASRSKTDNNRKGARGLNSHLRVSRAFSIGAAKSGAHRPKGRRVDEKYVWRALKEWKAGKVNIVYKIGIGSLPYPSS